MPNWCANNLTLSHTDKKKMEEVYSLLSRIEDSEGDGFFNFFMPEPKDPESSDGVFPGWYSWRVENWGTKWEPNILSWDQIDDLTISLNFDTAWGPPIGVYDTMVEDLGFSVEANYFEPGMAFVGAYTDGVDEYYEFANCSSKDVREKIGEDLDDMWCISEQLAEWEEEEAQNV